MSAIEAPMDDLWLAVWVTVVGSAVIALAVWSVLHG